ncbi:SLC13 family permease [Georgenia sp. SUBG003]|uniref:SLC13 family permease n=1 Tax=Georgenia sp. SUBG003 TaxID=1497974 RepID=UPI003AB881A5
MTEAIPIPVTAILAMSVVVIFQVAPADEVFALFGNSTLFVFVGGFIIAESMRKHGLDRRFAFGVLSPPPRHAGHRQRRPRGCRRAAR